MGFLPVHAGGANDEDLHLALAALFCGEGEGSGRTIGDVSRHDVPAVVDEVETRPSDRLMVLASDEYALHYLCDTQGAVGEDRSGCQKQHLDGFPMHRGHRWVTRDDTGPLGTFASTSAPAALSRPVAASTL